jgi:PrtD family type I secretion system ABC transporter
MIATGQRSSEDTASELQSAIRSTVSAFWACALFSFLINLLMLGPPIYMLQIYDRVLTTGHGWTLFMLTLLVSATLVVMCILEFLRTAVMVRIGSWFSERLGPVYISAGVRGWLGGDLGGTQAQRDISQIQTFIATQGLTAFFDIPWVPIFVALVWMLHPLLGIVALVSAVLLLVLSFVNEYATRRRIEKSVGKGIESNRLVEAIIRNAELVHAMNMQPALIDRWAQLNGAALAASRQANDAAGVILGITKFVRFFVQIAIMAVGAWLVIDAKLTAGSMIAASILLGRALAPVEIAQAAWRNFMGARLAYSRLKQLIEKFPTPATRTWLPEPDGQLVVENVSYVSPTSPRLLLNGISFSVEPGEALAIIGPSGAGKSTLCRLLVGLITPNAGEVRLAGSLITHWNATQIGRCVGFLPQDVDVFAGTVRQNIARMQDADDHDIIQAAILAHAHEMVQRLPDGYETLIGEGGLRLSGGQRQRVGLARAVFGMPQLVILDEPNASLDQAGEAALGEAIVALKARGAGLIIVGHRPSTLERVDKILMLQDGNVHFYGPRDEVLQAVALSSQPRHEALVTADAVAGEAA